MAVSPPHLLRHQRHARAASLLPSPRHLHAPGAAAEVAAAGRGGAGAAPQLLTLMKWKVKGAVRWGPEVAAFALVARPPQSRLLSLPLLG